MLTIMNCLGDSLRNRLKNVLEQWAEYKCEEQILEFTKFFFHLGLAFPFGSILSEISLLGHILVQTFLSDWFLNKGCRETVTFIP